MFWKWWLWWILKCFCFQICSQYLVSYLKVYNFSNFCHNSYLFWWYILLFYFCLWEVLLASFGGNSALSFSMALVSCYFSNVVCVLLIDINVSNLSYLRVVVLVHVIWDCRYVSCWAFVVDVIRYLWSSILFFVLMILLGIVWIRLHLRSLLGVHQYLFGSIRWWVLHIWQQVLRLRESSRDEVRHYWLCVLGRLSVARWILSKALLISRRIR